MYIYIGNSTILLKIVIYKYLKYNLLYYKFADNSNILSC